MSSLTENRRPAGPLADGSAPYWLVPVLAALRAAGTAVFVLLVPVVMAWVFGSDEQVTWTQTLRVTLDVWLLAHHVGLVLGDSLGGGHVGLVPFGLFLLPVLSCWAAGSWLARTLDPRAERIAAGTTRARPLAAPRVALVLFVAAYLGLAGLGAVICDVPALRPVTAQVVLGSTLLAALAGTGGARAYELGGARAVVADLCGRLPAVVTRVLPAAGVAVALPLFVSALLLAAMIGFGASRVTDLYVGLDAGWVGGALLTVGQMLVLPNLVVWVAAALCGPGFAVGSGTAVTLGHVTLGPLPAVPVLGALPADGPLPGPVWGLLAVPALAGALAAVRLRRSTGPSPLGVTVRDLAALAGLAGVAMLVLAWACGGPAGPGRLAGVGPSPLLTAAAFTGEVFLGALSLVGVQEARRWRAERPARVDVATPVTADPGPDAALPAATDPLAPVGATGAPEREERDEPAGQTPEREEPAGSERVDEAG